MPRRPQRSSAEIAAEQDMLMAWLRECARKGETCPTNKEIADRFGLTSVGHASDRLTKLERTGRIRILRGQSARVVSCSAEGWQTAGDVGAPHIRRGAASGSIAPRGSVASAGQTVSASAEVARNPLIPVQVVLRQAELDALLRDRPGGSAGEVIAGLVREVVLR